MCGQNEISHVVGVDRVLIASNRDSRVGHRPAMVIDHDSPDNSRSIGRKPNGSRWIKVLSQKECRTPAQECILYGCVEDHLTVGWPDLGRNIELPSTFNFLRLA